VTQSDHITITWNGHCACAVWRESIKGSLLEHPHFKAIFGSKKHSSKNRSAKWRFFGNL